MTPGREAISKTRLEAFSDGVIAVAITLLVLDLRVPADPGPGSLAQRLGEQWPNYLAYAISFLAIGIIWINHHAMLRRVASVDHSILVLNVLLLLCIVVLPFTTALMASYLDAPQGGHLAAVVYAGSFMLSSAVFFALQWHVLHRPHLLVAQLTKQQRRSILLRSAVSAPAYAVAAAAGLLTPYLTLGLSVALGVFYLLPFSHASPSAEQQPAVPRDDGFFAAPAGEER